MSLPGSMSRHASFGSMANEVSDGQITFPNYANGVMTAMPQSLPDIGPTVVLPTRPMAAMGTYQPTFNMGVNPNDVLTNSSSYFGPMADATFPGDFNMPNFAPEELAQEGDIKNPFLR